MLLINKIKHETEGLKFLCRNLLASRNIQPIPEANFGDFILRGLSHPHISKLDALHRLLRNGRAINCWRKMLLRMKGCSLCGVATEKNGELLGFNLYYFRPQEMEHGIIHEAFVGVIPQARGRGIATALKMHLAKHFAFNGLKGISAQIRIDNGPSLYAAKRAGFQIMENKDGLLQLYSDLTNLRF